MESWLHLSHKSCHSNWACMKPFSCYPSNSLHLNAFPFALPLHTPWTFFSENLRWVLLTAVSFVAKQSASAGLKNTVMCLASLLLCPSCFWWAHLCDCVLPTLPPTFNNHHHQSFNWIQETPEGEGGAVTAPRPKIFGWRMGAFVRGTFMCKCEGSSDFPMPVSLSYKPYLCAPKASATLTRTNSIS